MRKWWYIALSIPSAGAGLLAAAGAGRRSLQPHLQCVAGPVDRSRAHAGTGDCQPDHEHSVRPHAGRPVPAVRRRSGAADFGFHRGAGVRLGSASGLSPWWAAGLRGTCCLASPCWPMAGSSTWAFSISTSAWVCASGRSPSLGSGSRAAWRSRCRFWCWPIWPTRCRWSGLSACCCTSGWRGGCRRARAFTSPPAGCWAWWCSRSWWGIRCSRAGRRSRSRWPPARTRSGFSTASITSCWWDC